MPNLTLIRHHQGILEVNKNHYQHLLHNGILQMSGDKRARKESEMMPCNTLPFSSGKLIITFVP